VKIHLYLDVDGVLNAYDRLAYEKFSGEGLPSKWDGGYEYFRADNGFRIAYAPEMIARLNEVIARHGIVCHWLTTWEYEARQLGERLGITGSEEWEVLDAMQYSRKGGWLKLDSIKDHITETTPDVVIWFDDDIFYEDEARNWADAEGLYWHAPTGAHGITPEMLDEVDASLDILGVQLRLVEALTELDDRAACE
jgi:hypothetical protein